MVNKRIYILPTEQPTPAFLFLAKLYFFESATQRWVTRDRLFSAKLFEARDNRVPESNRLKQRMHDATVVQLVARRAASCNHLNSHVA